jgi:hypothetical protein
MMSGIVVAYLETGSVGVIRTVDGKKLFAKHHWKSDSDPRQGALVVVEQGANGFPEIHVEH